MTDKQQIDFKELHKDLQNIDAEMAHIYRGKIIAIPNRIRAERLLEIGYRKLPEDSVVISQKEICDLADEVQALGFRVCPRNIYQDEKSKKTCNAISKGECRKRYATCFKKYFKELKGEL